MAEEKTTHEIIRYILSLPSPEYKRYTPFTHGVCTACGQLVAVSDKLFTTQEAANDYALMNCNCSISERLQSKSRAIKNIEELFGPTCEEFGKEPVSESAIDILCKAVNAVGCGEIEKMSMDIKGRFSQIKGKVSINSKGVIAIDRADTQKSQRSI